jgi:excisionase family DNA binding protein
MGPEDQPLTAAALAVMLPDLSRVEHLAERLHLSPRTVRRLLKEGTLPGIKICGRWVIEKQALLVALRRRASGVERR